MNFSEKLKEIRRSEGLSQEQLAEKIGVSRQAVTKWETGKGLPDIENMVVIADIFKITLDELVHVSASKEEHLPEIYTSETVYDIECAKRFDIKIGRAKSIKISSDSGGKIRVALKSETLSDIGELFKIKFDENKNCLDVNCVKIGEIPQSEAEDQLWAEIVLPEKFTVRAELAADVKLLEIINLNIPRFEFDGAAEHADIWESSGSLEFTSRSDYDITVDRVCGSLDINQWKARTTLHIAEKFCPAVLNKGRKCAVFFMKNGKRTDNYQFDDSENTVSVSGISSELVVELVDAEKN